MRRVAGTMAVADPDSAYPTPPAALLTSVAPSATSAAASTAATTAAAPS